MLRSKLFATLPFKCLRAVRCSLERSASRVSRPWTARHELAANDKRENAGRRHASSVRSAAGEPSAHVIVMPVAYRELYVTEVNVAAGLRCPRCETADGLQRVGHLQMSMCTVCHGAFVGFARIEELMQTVERPGEIQQLALQYPVTLRATLLRCPCCDAELQRGFFFQQLVDVCAVHGVWFDVGELVAAMERMRLLLGVLTLVTASPVATQAHTAEMRFDPALDPKHVLARMLLDNTLPLVVDNATQNRCTSCNNSKLQWTGHWQRCIACGGLFIDFARLARIADALDLGELPTYMQRQSRPTVPATIEVCPQCNYRMHTVVFFQTLVDVCDIHGVWFDVGELNQAVDAMEAWLRLLRAPTQSAPD